MHDTTRIMSSEGYAMMHAVYGTAGTKCPCRYSVMDIDILYFL